MTPAAGASGFVNLERVTWMYSVMQHLTDLAAFFSRATPSARLADQAGAAVTSGWRAMTALAPWSGCGSLAQEIMSLRVARRRTNLEESTSSKRGMSPAARARGLRGMTVREVSCGLCSCLRRDWWERAFVRLLQTAPA